MKQLSIQSRVMPAAPLGGENPLTPLRSYETASAAGASVLGDADHPDRGNESSVLPYKLQDQYTRDKSPRAFKTAVLENDHLRATFLLELGGRLWSLFHKPTQRELLHTNPVFQPANLAVRDAWFSGGVEWNIAIIGHSPSTCSPLFAARLTADDGTPVLRLYEWDRIRRLPWQIDFWLPNDRAFLMTRVRITNPNDHTVPMYWWSNIAVDERKDVRVLGPGDKAYRHDYDGSLVQHDVPTYNGVDLTYTTNRHGAADMYFQIPQGQRPWIAAVDKDGRGLAHTSTSRLYGRKMFNWGIDQGGRRWQEFLSQRGQAYIEIQGGLAPTQGDYQPMPAGAEWSWLEAYGLVEADPVRAHGADWAAARQSVEQQLDRHLPRMWLESELARTEALAKKPPEELLHQGSGWAALERRRAGSSRVLSPSSFPDSSLGEEQMPWLALLDHGRLPYRPATSDPGPLMVQPDWAPLLEGAAKREDAHWLTWYHLGVMRFRHGDPDGARAAWQQSLQLEASAYAHRDLAVLAREEGDERRASELWLTATRVAPDLLPLAIEAAKSLYLATRYEELLGFCASRSSAIREHGRIRLWSAMASLAVGDLEAVCQYFQGDCDIANIREKETSLSDLWFGYHEQRLSRDRKVPVTDELRRHVRSEFPPPMRFDFRLRSE